MSDLWVKEIGQTQAGRLVLVDTLGDKKEEYLFRYKDVSSIDEEVGELTCSWMVEKSGVTDNPDIFEIEDEIIEAVKKELGVA